MIVYPCFGISRFPTFRGTLGSGIFASDLRSTTSSMWWSVSPKNLFYNTVVPGKIIVIKLNKRKRHPDEILLVNASKLFAKNTSSESPGLP